MERQSKTGPTVVVCVFILVCCGTARGTVIYMDDDARVASDGSSWMNAYRFLQDALADANDSERPVEIRVAQGLYKPDRGAGHWPSDPEATFQLQSGVVLKGGYAGLGAPEPNERDIQLYESILSGDLTGDDPDVNVPQDLLYHRGWNSRTVVTGSGTDSTAVLDGFTIRGGYGDAPLPRINRDHPPGPTGSGGGMNNLAGSPAVIRCTFINNLSHGIGGGMCNAEGSHPAVIDCAFVGNYARGRGGALGNSGHSDPTLTRCIFTQNSALLEGGAVYNNKSGPTLDRCSFTHNTAGPRVHGSGGAVYCEESTCTLTDCVFIENSTSSGGAICTLDDNSLFLERCTFIGNSAGTGGAILGEGRSDSFIITACTFRRNSAHGSGGAMRLFGPMHVSGCTFTSNTAWAFGGAADVRRGTITNCLFVGNRAIGYPYVDPEGILVPSAGYGGAISQFGSIDPLHVMNCTFHENRAVYGSAVGTDGWPGLHSCILRGPIPLIRADPWEAQPMVAFSNVEGGWPGKANTDVDPLFVDPGYWDPNGTPDYPSDDFWIDGDYHLKSQAGRWDPASMGWALDDVTSPCVDAGDPNSPISREPFPNGGRINMGACGGTAGASKSYFGEPVCDTIIAGDINGDCRVDWGDLAILARHWLEDRAGR